MNATYQGPRFGPRARPELDGQRVVVSRCDCLTCSDLGPWLTEPHYTVSPRGGGVFGHVPASDLRGIAED